MPARHTSQIIRLEVDSSFLGPQVLFSALKSCHLLFYFFNYVTMCSFRTQAMELSKGHGNEMSRLQHLIEETSNPAQVTHTHSSDFNLNIVSLKGFL